MMRDVQRQKGAETKRCRDERRKEKDRDVKRQRGAEIVKRRYGV